MNKIEKNINVVKEGVNVVKRGVNLVIPLFLAKNFEDYLDY